MNLVDFTIRHAIPALGIATRWLKEELDARNVSIPLTDACLRELVTDADSAARIEATARDASSPYTSCLRSQIAARADFLRRWTQSDERIDVSHPGNERLVKVARNFALPRPWKLSEPVASECLHRVPSYVNWARA